MAEVWHPYLCNWHPLWRCQWTGMDGDVVCVNLSGWAAEMPLNYHSRLIILSLKCFFVILMLT